MLLKRVSDFAKKEIYSQQYKISRDNKTALTYTGISELKLEVEILHRKLILLILFTSSLIYYEN